MRRLVEESTVVRWKSSGRPAQIYQVELLGRSLTRESGRVGVRSQHRVEIRLGASYPLTAPEIRWLTPIFHPNISEIGMVCLGGFGSHWVPSLRLDALVGMLWDMARYYNYDIRSPYNRDAALWAAKQATFTFPVDPRPLRDLRVAQGRVEPAAAEAARPAPTAEPAPAPPVPPQPADDVVFILE